MLAPSPFADQTILLGSAVKHQSWDSLANLLTFAECGNFVVDFYHQEVGDLDTNLFGVSKESSQFNVLHLEDASKVGTYEINY